MAPGTTGAAGADCEVVLVVPHTVMAELDALKLRAAVAPAARAALRQLQAALADAAASGGFVRGQSFEVGR